MKNKIIFLFLLFMPLASVQALSVGVDTDGDGLTDEEELNIFFTDVNNKDTDQDGWLDGVEARSGWDPNVNEDKKLEKRIEVSLKNQELSFYSGRYKLNSFKISSGDTKHPTPTGTYSIIVKKPLVTYKGVDYFYPNTKWNLMFKKGTLGNFYIYGAYWHDNFGKRVSHGCINVAYENMEQLYNWAEERTSIVISNE